MKVSASPAIITLTRTPRATARASATPMSRSGTKYGELISIDSRAQRFA